MKNTRKRLSLLSLLICTALLTGLTGCGGTGSTGSNESSSGTPSQSQSSTAASSTAASSTAGNDEAIVFTILDWNAGAAVSKGIEAMAALYTKDHPNVTCEIEQMDGSQIFVAYKNRIAAGDPPDLFQGKPRTYTEFIDGGYVADLSDRPFLDKINPSLKEEIEYNGKFWGVPIDAQTKGVFYSKDMFAEHGIEVPTTRDEFIAVLDAFAAKGINPLCQPLGENGNTFHIVDCIYTPLFSLRGQPNIWLDSKAGTAPVAGNELVKEVYELYNTILTYRDPNDPGYSVFDAFNEIGTGKRPMMINGGWSVVDILAVAEDAGNTIEFGYFPLPWSNDPAENKMWFGLDGTYLVSGKSPHQDVLFDFVESFISPEGAKIWMDCSRNMTSRIDVELTDALPHVIDMQGYLDKDQVISKARVRDYSSESLVTFKNLNREFGCRSDGERNVDAFLAEIDAEIDAMNS